MFVQGEKQQAYQFFDIGAHVLLHARSTKSDTKASLPGLSYCRRCFSSCRTSDTTDTSKTRSTKSDTTPGLPGLQYCRRCFSSCWTSDTTDTSETRSTKSDTTPGLPGLQYCRRCFSSCRKLWWPPIPPGSWTPWSLVHGLCRNHALPAATQDTGTSLHSSSWLTAEWW